VGWSSPAGRATRVPYRRVNHGTQRTTTVTLTPPMSCPCPLGQHERIPRMCLIRMRSQVQGRPSGNRLTQHPGEKPTATGAGLVSPRPWWTLRGQPRSSSSGPCFGGSPTSGPGGRDAAPETPAGPPDCTPGTSGGPPERGTGFRPPEGGRACSASCARGRGSARG
jgi:hypothetical protein